MRNTRYAEGVKWANEVLEDGFDYDILEEAVEVSKQYNDQAFGEGVESVIKMGEPANVST